MKGISFLCENSKITESRNIGSTVFGTTNILMTPVSNDGKGNPTHWYCFLKVSDSDYQKVLAIKKNCIIEECNPSIFLKKHGLKLIENNTVQTKKNDKES